MSDYGERKIKLVPYFGSQHFNPSTPCPHVKDIPEGSVFCCMVCHKSGKDRLIYKRGRPIQLKDKPRPKKSQVESSRKPTLTRRQQRSQKNRPDGVLGSSARAASVQ